MSPDTKTGYDPRYHNKHESILCGRKIVFGDPEQIAAYKLMNFEAAKEEARGRKRAAGKTKTYRVYVEISGDYSIEVEAVDEVEAKELALEEAIEAINPNDIEVEAYRIKLVEKKKERDITTCSYCGGDGLEINIDLQDVDCEKCHGTGLLEIGGEHGGS
jgi:PDZ domain-containing secreted protein